MACVALLLSAFIITGCATANIANQPTGRTSSKPIRWRADTECMANAPVQPDATRETLAVECLNASSKRERDFIAMALSGGGTKAAVFSAEAMFYLEALDLLHRVSVVSAVSGGSFTAGLYALSCEPNDLAPTAYNAACKPGTQAIREARYGNTPTF